MRDLSFGRPLVGAALLALALAACTPGSSAPPPTTVDAPPPGSASSAASAPSASATPGASGTASTSPKQCGCSLCEPVVSEDACTTDADCAPSVPCHAPACVAKAKAVPRKPDTMCDMMMVCASVDANTCGCLKGKCALYPKASR